MRAILKVNIPGNKFIKALKKGDIIYVYRLDDDQRTCMVTDYVASLTDKNAVRFNISRNEFEVIN